MKKANQGRSITLWALIALAVVNIAYANAASDGVKEDFETGDFSRFPWDHVGDDSWTITSSEKHSGSYSAQAGNIGDSEASTLQVKLDCESGTITFYLRVSSESGYDYLKFYIDGVEKDKWSGEEDWTEVSFPVISGTRTFEWTYSKDGSTSEDDDTAWIDDIIFPIALSIKNADNPNPPDGARFVDTEANLSWTAGADAVMHDLYFGTNESRVANGTGGTFKGSLSTTTYDPGTLAQDRTYYWRVDEFDGITTHKGDIWSFTTCPEISMTTYEITASSYIGGSGDDDSVRGCGIQSDGTVVLAANISNAAPGGVEPILLNGATQSSNGAIIRLSPDGTTVLSVTRVADLLLDLALDDSDNIYVALWAQGMAKLDPTATFIQWQKKRGNVNRIDAGPAGYCTTLVVTEAEPDTYRDVVHPSIANIRVYDPSGSELVNFLEHRMTFDVCIDEASQAMVHIGWRQAYDWASGSPVQIAYVQGRTYTGSVLWTSYDWSIDPDSDRYLNKSGENMADTRGYRCSIGPDRRLYCVFECAGGNHIFRYDPFDIMIHADIVGGDEWFEFWNTSAEHKTFIGRYEPTSGELLLGQQFCCRLEDYKGNSARVQLGEVCADEFGRVYVGGRASWGLPVPGHPRYTPAPGQIAFNPLNGYLGGGFLLVLSQDFKTRLYCTRLTNSFSGHNDYTHAIAARILSGSIANIAFAGSCSTELYTKAEIQNNVQGDRDGWFAVIPPAVAPSILYVDARASGENNGTSWLNAFIDLQDAFAAGVAIPKVEVRVAEGVYLPDRGRSVTRGDRTASFQLIDDVSIIGGYAGLGASNPNARDIERYKTILSGDIGIPDIRLDNTYHVVTGTGVSASAILDGFTLTAGYADGPNNFGGGVYIGRGSPTIINCIISRNSTDVQGGGMYIGSIASPRIMNCIFSGNWSGRGGGVFNNGYRGEYGATPQFVNCTFIKNSADREGGGVFAYTGSFPTLLNCILWGNTPEEIYLHRTPGLITYSDVQGGWPGQGNIDTDPLFANPRIGDYHLRSRAGRWDPISQKWIQDNVTSPCIDAGDPSRPVGDEPQPNGGRINMGAYGGTAEASKSIR